MSNKYLRSTMTRNMRRVARRSLRSGRSQGGSAGSSRRTNPSGGLLWWLLIVVGVILLAGVVSWFQGADDDALEGHPEDAEAGTLVRVVDGDTLVVELDGEQERVRLLNIDTPESVHPTEPVECLGPEASAHMDSLVAPGDSVVLEFDQERTDQYDRLLAGVWREEVLLNAQMARDGYGAPVLFPPNDRFLTDVEEAWAQAESDGVGLFDDDLDCEPALP